MYVGMDIGGTNIRIAISETLQPVRLTQKIALPNLPDYAENERRIIETIEKYPAVRAIGISIAGKLNQERTGLANATYLPQWIGHPIADTLRKRFSCPVLMHHDAWCSASAEASRRRKDFLFLVYGTGFGGAIVRYRHARPEIRKLNSDEHAAYLRPWQEACGGRSLEREFGKPAKSFSDAEWDIAMNRFGEHFLKFTRRFKPRTLVLGSGVATKQWERIAKTIKELKQEHDDLRDLTVEPSRFGEDAGLVGAITLLDDKKYPTETTSD